MGGTFIAIELLSERMDVAAVKGGKVSASRRIPLDLSSEPTAWVRDIRAAAARLATAVTELNAQGRPARIVYRSPTQTVDLASFELRSAAQACSAAELPAVEALPYSTSSAIIWAEAVGRDRSGLQRRWHVVVAADRIDIVRALVEMATEAGLRFESATPLDAVIMTSLVRRALRFTGPRHGWLHFGQHSSFFILGGEGRVTFERSIALGMATIAQSLTRPIRMPDEESIELDSDTATDILQNHGIPRDDEVVSEQPQLTRRHIMPLVQPVLQRYVVELRQSLRFGLPDEQRSNIEITVSGPGSHVPGLIELIAWELKLEFTADPDYDGYDYREPAGRGSELRDAIAARSVLDRINLQPPESARRRESGRLRRWLWSGAAAAVALVVVDGIRLQARLSETRRNVETLKAAANEAQLLAQTHTKLVAAIEALGELDQVVVETVGARANMRAILQELSRLTPDSVRLSSMRFAREDKVLAGRLYGRAEAVPGSGQTEVESFIEALKKSPLFSDASLRNVERGSGRSVAGERFEATFDAILAPEGEPEQVARTEDE